MTLKELARTLTTPVGSLIKKAQQHGLNLNPNSHLTPNQIEILKSSDNIPRLKPSESKPGELGEIKSSSEEPKSLLSTITNKQQQISQSSQAEEAQFNHQTLTRLQQSFAEGQELGCLEVLVKEEGRLGASLALSQVLFSSDMNRREKSLSELADKMSSDDFFGKTQSPSESYYKSQMQSSPLKPLNLTQILQNSTIV
jgi:hypothetical protein